MTRSVQWLTYRPRMTGAFTKRLFRLLGITVGVGLCAGPAMALADTGDPVLILSLQEALSLAVEGGPSVAATRAQWRSARGRADQARGERLPQLSMSAGYTRYQEPAIVVPIHEAGVFPPLDDDVYEAMAQLSVPLLDGGRRAATHQAATATAAEARARRDLSEQQIIEGVTSLFVRIRALEDTGHLITARLNVLRRRREELLLLWQEGRTSPADTALVAAALATGASDSLEVVTRQLEVATQLAALIGSDRAVHPIVADVGREPENGWPLELALAPAGTGPEASGPEVRAAQARLTRDRALKTQAASRFWPDVIGFGAYSLRSGGDRDAIGEWAAGIRLQVPLFDAGSRSSGLRAARASIEAAEALAQQALQNERAQVRIAQDQWHTSKARRHHLNVAAEAKSVSVAAQSELYREGRIPLSELLTQESELLQLQTQERAAAYAIVLAGLRYHAAAGHLTIDLAHRLTGSSS